MTQRLELYAKELAEVVKPGYRPQVIREGRGDERES